MKLPFVHARRLAPAAGLAFVIAGSVAGGVGAAAETADAHAEHGAMMAAPSDLRRSLVQYQVPNVTLVRDDGKSVSLAHELDDDRPVFLNFIYTDCTTICPLTSQVFEQLQRKLGAQARKVHLMSISIDPEQDTPARLRKYAQRFHAGPQWRYYTGTLEASLTAQRAFDVYRGDKMSHAAVTLVREAPGRPWVRLDGFATADQLYAEYREIVASR